MYNILTEPLIRFDRSDGKRTEASLPEIYAALLADTVIAFPALRPHQRHAWHAFLVQLGAMAMHRAGVDTPPESAEEWAKLIRGLTPDHPDDEPWQFVVDDITKPAFMQPPASSKDREKDYKATVDTPDELDMLVTSKNHDLKSAVAVQADVDDWIFALVTLQTMDGNPGRNPGISRMNRSHGNRPAFSLTPSTRPGLHIRRDLTALPEHIPSIMDECLTSDDGIPLVWTLPWDGKMGLPISDLNPLYIEICRRFRLCLDSQGRLYAIKAVAAKERIAAKELNGQTGDPWTPINRKESKCLTLSEGGFTYKKVVEYLLEPEWHHPPLLKTTSRERESRESMLLIARAMVRGQGETKGYHERIIPLRHRILQVFGRPAEAENLGDIANKRIKIIAATQNILKDAVETFIAHGGKLKDLTPAERRRVRKKAELWSNQLDGIVDHSFFEDLQTEFEIDDKEEREKICQDWLENFVVANAGSLLNAARKSIPCPSIHRYRAFASAQNLFNGLVYQEFGISLDDSEED